MEIHNSSEAREYQAGGGHGPWQAGQGAPALPHSFGITDPTL